MRTKESPSSLSTSKCNAKAELLEQCRQAEEPDKRQAQSKDKVYSVSPGWGVSIRRDKVSWCSRGEGYSLPYPSILCPTLNYCIPKSFYIFLPELSGSQPCTFSCHGGTVVLCQHEKPCWGLKKGVDFYSEALKKNEYIVGTPCGSLSPGRDCGSACESLSLEQYRDHQPVYILTLCPYSVG